MTKKAERATVTLNSLPNESDMEILLQMDWVLNQIGFKRALRRMSGLRDDHFFVRTMKLQLKEAERLIERP